MKHRGHPPGERCTFQTRRRHVSNTAQADRGGLRIKLRKRSRQNTNVGHREVQPFAPVGGTCARRRPPEKACRTAWARPRNYSWGDAFLDNGAFCKTSIPGFRIACEARPRFSRRSIDLRPRRERTASTGGSVAATSCLATRTAVVMRVNQFAPKKAALRPRCQASRTDNFAGIQLTRWRDGGAAHAVESIAARDKVTGNFVDFLSALLKRLAAFAPARSSKS